VGERPQRGKGWWGTEVDTKLARNPNTLLSIGDFSRMTFLSVKTLHHYHEIGLLPPAAIDPASGYRRYRVAQVATAQVIRRLRDLGMPLEELKGVLRAPDVRARNAAILAHLRRMEEQLQQTQAAVAALRNLLEHAATPIAVEYRAVGALDTIAIRERISSADTLEWLVAAFEELRAALGPLSARRVGADGCLYTAELLEEERGEAVAYIPIATPARRTGRVAPLALPATEFAVALHQGPFDTIDQTYAALGAVVAERAIGVPGPLRELYVVGPLDTADEARHRTEVCWPIFQTAPGAQP
jgi:DNA-binding transcriptional MerR regulator